MGMTMTEKIRVKRHGHVRVVTRKVTRVVTVATGRNLAQQFRKLDKLLEATPEQIEETQGVGPKMAVSIHDQLQDPQMRALLSDHVFRADLMASALAINAVLLVASFAAFIALLNSARRHGSLLGGGE